jgi:hypothetical protein
VFNRFSGSRAEADMSVDLMDDSVASKSREKKKQTEELMSMFDEPSSVTTTEEVPLSNAALLEQRRQRRQKRREMEDRGRRNVANEALKSFGGGDTDSKNYTNRNTFSRGSMIEDDYDDEANIMEVPPPSQNFGISRKPLPSLNIGQSTGTRLPGSSPTNASGKIKLGFESPRLSQKDLRNLSGSPIDLNSREGDGEAPVKVRQVGRRSNAFSDNQRQRRGFSQPKRIATSGNLGEAQPLDKDSEMMELFSTADSSQTDVGGFSMLHEPFASPDESSKSSRRHRRKVKADQEEN